MKTVLVADDEKEILAAFQLVLAPYVDEIRLLTAADGGEAVELLESEPVDLLITDLNMPVLSGFQVLAQLTKNHKTIPVIVTTGYGSASTRQQLSSLGPLTYVEKPFQISELVEKVRLVLGQAAKGYVQGITLASFLQLLHLERKSCSISVFSRSSHGTLEMLGGELVDAGRGGVRGEGAALDLLGWDDVEIVVEAAPKRCARSIQRPLMELLLQAAEQRDEAERGLLEAWASGGTPNHERSAWLQNVELALARLLLESTSSAPSLLEIIETLARHLSWHFAAFWSRNAATELLRCEAVWISPTLAEPGSIDEASVQSSLAGQELVRRAFASQEAAWVADVDLDPGFAGGASGSVGGFRSAMALPVSIGSSKLGVIDLRNAWRRERDDELLRWLADFGPRLARFLEHSRSDRDRAELIERERIVISEIHELESRTSFIAEASAVLSCSLEESVLIDSLIRLVVSRLADWCILDLVEPGGELRRSAVVHRNPLKLEWAEELRLARSPFADARSPILRVARTGKAEICGEEGQAVPELLWRDEPNGEVLRRLGLHSAMIVPLSARNRTLGVLTLVSGDPDRRYRREDLETARELAHRAALAIENARLAESCANPRRGPAPVEPSGSLQV